MPLPPQFSFGGYCSCLITEIRVKFKGLSRVMSLPTSLLIKVRIGLKGLLRVMLLLVSFVRMSILLYAAVFLAFVQNIEDRVVYSSFDIFMNFFFLSFGNVSFC